MIQPGMQVPQHTGNKIPVPVLRVFFQELFVIDTLHCFKTHNKAYKIHTCPDQKIEYIIHYFVPKIRSPASPSPGTIYPFSFNFSSNAAK